MAENIAAQTADAPFAYGDLDAGLATQLREHATFIKDRNKRMHEDAIAIGARLLAVKDSLPHGRFLPWVEAECGWTARTAQNLMSAAEAFSGKSETVSYLPQATVYALASAPEAIRTTILATIEAKRPGAEEVKELVRAAKADAQSQRQRARKSPEERKAEERKQVQERRAADRRAADFAARDHERQKARTRVALALRRCWPGEVEELVAMLNEAQESQLATWVLHPYGTSVVSGIHVPNPAPE